MCVPCVCIAHKGPEEGVRFSVTRVTDGCEQPCGFGELIPGPLEEQSVLLATELSLQPLEDFNIRCIHMIPIHLDKFTG